MQGQTVVKWEELKGNPVNRHSGWIRLQKSKNTKIDQTTKLDEYGRKTIVIGSNGAAERL